MNSEPREANLGPGDIAFAVAMIVIAALALLAHLGAAGFSCAWDTSECAHSTSKEGVYEGTIRTKEGDLYSSQEFDVEFGSRGDELRFQTDANGRYCIHWADERVTYVRTPAGEPLAANKLGFSGLGRWRDLNGGDPPPGCQESDAGVPWNQADNAESTWQNWLLIILPLAAIAALLAAILARWTPYAARLFAAGGALLAANLVAFVALWLL